MSKQYNNLFLASLKVELGGGGGPLELEEKLYTQELMRKGRGGEKKEKKLGSVF